MEYTFSKVCYIAQICDISAEENKISQINGKGTGRSDADNKIDSQHFVYTVSKCQNLGDTSERGRIDRSVLTGEITCRGKQQ